MPRPEVETRYRGRAPECVQRRGAGIKDKEICFDDRRAAEFSKHRTQTHEESKVSLTKTPGH